MRRKVFESFGTVFWGHLCLGNRHPQSKAKPVSHIGFDGIQRGSFKAWKPVNSRIIQTQLKVFVMDSPVGRKVRRLKILSTTGNLAHS